MTAGRAHGSPTWWGSPGVMLVPLRLFLGVTFAYAGLQKLANPDFLRSSSPISIHAQLVGAQRVSPIHGLIGGLVHVAPLVGWVIALGELAIGIGTLVGLWTRVAAIAGMALSLGLFLTVSFHSSPYFTGADIVFLFAWTPLAIAGAAGAPALDTYLGGPPTGSGPEPGAHQSMSRRDVVSKGAAAGAVAAAVVVGGGLTAWIGRLVGGTQSGDHQSTGGGSAPATTTTTTPTSTTAGPGSPSTTAPPTTTAPVPGGRKLMAATAVPVGRSVNFTDPASGDPALVIQGAAGSFVAFDAVCPHAGCTVAYQASARIIACPCHGSEFNAKTGAVETGPADRGLTPIKIVEGPNGDLYVDG